MTEAQLPPGYMLVSGVGIHVAKIRTFTSDLQRFKRVLPLLDRIERHKPSSPQWETEVTNILDEYPNVTPGDIIDTLREAAEINSACLKELEAEGRRRGYGKPQDAA